MSPKQEQIIIENTLRLLRKGQFTVNGDEVLVFHQCFSYLIEKLKSLEPKPIPPTVPVKEEVIKKPKKVKENG